MAANLIDVMGKHFGLKTSTKRINGIPVEIKGYIDFDTFGNIVQTVARSCFQDGEYRAENREVVRRFVILKYFTDIEVDTTNIVEIFKNTQGGNWFSEIERDVTNLPVWAEVELAIDKQIDYLIATKRTAFDDLCTDLSGVIKTDNKQNLDDVKKVLTELNKVDKEAFVKEVVKKNVKGSVKERGSKKS